MSERVTEAGHQLAAASWGVGNAATSLENIEYHAKSGHFPDPLSPEDAQKVFDMETRLAELVETVFRIQRLLDSIPAADEASAS